MKDLDEKPLENLITVSSGVSEESNNPFIYFSWTNALRDSIEGFLIVFVFSPKSKNLQGIRSVDVQGWHTATGLIFRIRQ